MSILEAGWSQNHGASSVHEYSHTDADEIGRKSTCECIPLQQALVLRYSGDNHYDFRAALIPEITLVVSLGICLLFVPTLTARTTWNRNRLAVLYAGLMKDRMTPTLFNSTGTADEWHLCNVLGKQDCLQTLQNHWSLVYRTCDETHTNEQQIVHHP